MRIYLPVILVVKTAAAKQQCKVKEKKVNKMFENTFQHKIKTINSCSFNNNNNYNNNDDDGDDDDGDDDDGDDDDDDDDKNF